MSGIQFLSRAQLGAQLIKIALKYEGVRENPLGSNSGAQVRAFQAATSLAKSDPTGWPWCAAFDAHIFQELWAKLGVQWKPIWPNTASCDVLLGFGREKKILHATPRPYDVFLSLKNQNDAVHTGVVSDVLSSGRIETIEGNTNRGGSREGIGVFAFEGEDAKSPSGRGYVRWLDLMPERIECRPEAPLQPVAKPFAKTPKNAPAPRLILALAPYSGSDYHVLKTGRLQSHTWTVEAHELNDLFLGQLANEHKFPAATGRIRLRDGLKFLGVPVDELRTRLGNHLGDEDNPRQYVFIASVPQGVST